MAGWNNWFTTMLLFFKNAEVVEVTLFLLVAERRVFPCTQQELRINIDQYQ